jgi:anthranilate/para-aminobenzoate synthase component II
MAAREKPLSVLLIDNYDSYTFNLFQQIAVVNGGAYAATAC